LRGFPKPHEPMPSEHEQGGTLWARSIERPVDAKWCVKVEATATVKGEKGLTRA
jgi:hypothetical protein